ncbi:hypothetical protein PsYK624_104150 [Phanerochaete sordida]|uniref:NACHT domain-containing protein n=1 Tax=Phanerochaete sordida TaxID=48140 RepID=A0A9P3GG97_9APHY|nr:hypothetical protein PsYK624_104150 [Phanerochaete sordida]
MSNTVPDHLFADIDNWLSSEKRIYCLFGDAGTGKTPFAYHLCARLQSKQQTSAALGASFFFACNDQYLDSLRFFLPAIAYTLQPQLRSEIVETVREYLYEGGKEQEKAAAEQLICKALDAGPPYPSGPGGQSRTVLVIDGIDKCRDTEDVPGLLRYLFGLVRGLPWLYMVITSRPRPSVMSAFADPSCADILHRRDLDDGMEKWQGDAKKYLESVVQDIPACRTFLVNHPSTLPRLLKYAKDDPAFTRILIAFLEMTRDDLEIPLRSLLTPFARQDVLYQCILQSAASRMSPSLQRKAVTLLEFVALGGFIFSTNRNIFLGRNSSADDIALITDSLRPVLGINSDAEIVLLHPPFREFLLSRRSWRHLVEPMHTDSNAELTSTCLAVFANANPVMNILITNKQPLPGLNGVPGLKHPLLTLWPQQLSKAKCTAQLVDQLVGFVPSPQLCIYAWVTDTTQAMRAGEAIIRVAKQLDRRGRLKWDDGDMARVCAEYFLFVVYVQLWREHLHKSNTADDVDPPGLSDRDVLRRIAENCRDAKVGISAVFPGRSGSTSVDRSSSQSLDLRLRDGKPGAGPDLIISTGSRVYDFVRYNAITMDFRRALQVRPGFMDQKMFEDVKSGAYRIDDWV